MNSGKKIIFFIDCYLNNYIDMYNQFYSIFITFLLNFNEKIPFNIEKIAKNRKIPKKNPKNFENAQKVKFSGHCQGGNLKNF